MRKQFVQVETEEEALDTCPWAAMVVPVAGGYMCFESRQDWLVWNDQL